jgi:acetyl-CoA synthetase
MSEAHSSSSGIQSTLVETRVFPPPAEFAKKSHISSMDQYKQMYKKSIEQPEAFFEEAARELTWFSPWTKVLDWQSPYAKWFVGAKTNLAYNCLDRQVATGKGDKIALISEGEPYANGQATDVRKFTYSQLLTEVCKFANGLKSIGVSKGDRVTIYLPMVAEAVIAMLACARIGAAHSVVFGGFSSQAITDRVNDAQSHFLITADGGFRRGTTVKLKTSVDEALKLTSLVKKVVVLKRTGEPVNMTQGRDVWWHDLTAAASDHCPAQAMDSEDLLFVLYTSGSTGKPKGIQHTTGGYMVGTYLTSKYVFDLREDDIYFCTADVGWITGHSYVVYGLLNNGATVLLYEGAPNHPDFSRFWDICDRHQVTIFYTAPTAIRAFMRAGDQFVSKHSLKSLRLLGSVGEPINPEAWMWYHTNVGHSNCPIVDTWWQTETGAITISPLPGATPLKPCRSSASMPPSSTKTATNCPPTPAACSSFASRGPPCFAASSTTPTAT